MKKLPKNCRRVPLVNSEEFAIVDDFNYEWMMRSVWYEFKMPNGMKYAGREITKDGRVYIEFMHDLIMKTGNLTPIENSVTYFDN